MNATVYIISWSMKHCFGSLSNVIEHYLMYNHPFAINHPDFQQLAKQKSLSNSRKNTVPL